MSLSQAPDLFTACRSDLMTSRVWRRSVGDLSNHQLVSPRHTFPSTAGPSPGSGRPSQSAATSSYPLRADPPPPARQHPPSECLISPPGSDDAVRSHRGQRERYSVSAWGRNSVTTQTGVILPGHGGRSGDTVVQFKLIQCVSD